MSKVVLPSFSGEEYQPYELRQLVSALELRFQALEENDVSMFDTDTGFEFDDRYSQIGHTHTESEITDLRNYLLNIESESIFDLPDVTGTPANGDILQWNTVAAAFQAVPAGSSSFSLNDLDDVSVPAPTDGQVLTYDLGNLRWEAKGVGAGITSFVALTDTDLTGQQQYDLVFNATGSEWQDTDGELIWNPTADYLQLANAHSINWQDSLAQSTELLQFEETGTTTDPVEHIQFDTAVRSIETEMTFTDTTNGINQSQAGFVNGDEYLVVCRALMYNNNASSANENGFRMVVNGSVMTGSENLQDGSAHSDNRDNGNPYNYMGWFTANTAGGNLHSEIKRGHQGVDYRVVHDSAFVLNLTTGVPNHVKSFWTGSVDISTETWVTLDSIVIPAGDFIVFGAMQASGFSTANIPSLALYDGTTSFPLDARGVEESASDQLVMAGGHIILGHAGGTISVQGSQEGEGGSNNAIYASIIAIPLSDFSEWYAIQDTSLTPFSLMAQSTEEVVQTLSVPSIVNTGSDFLALSFSQANGVGPPIAGFQLEENLNSAGAVTVFWDHDWYCEKGSMASSPDRYISNTMFVNGLSYTAGDQVDLTILSEHGGSSYFNNGQLLHGIALINMGAGSTLVDTFVVGDPATPMQVDSTGMTLGNATDPDFMSIDQTGITVEGESGAGATGFAAHTFGAADGSFLDIYNDESTQEITLSVGGSTFLDGNVPHRFYFASFSDDLDIVGDLGVDSPWARLREDTAVKYFDIADGTHLRVYDDTEVDYVDFHHDGLNFTAAATTTSNFDFVGFTGDIRIRDGAGARWFNPADTVSVQVTVSSGGDFVWDNVGAGDIIFDDFTGNFDLNDGLTLRIFDSGMTDSAAFAHNGTDFNTEFTNTISWNITGLTVVEYFADVYNRSGSTLTMWDGADVDTFDLQHTGSHGQITTGGVAGGDIRMIPAGGAVDLRTGTDLRVRGPANTGYFEFGHDDTDALLRFFNTTDFDIRGAVVKIWDDGFTDNAAFSHDGTNFLTTFANTSNWNLSGALALQLTGGMDIDLRDAGILRIRDSGDTDYAEFSHDGGDFNTAFTNTAYWNITGATTRYSFDQPVKVQDRLDIFANITTANPPTTEAVTARNVYWEAGGGIILLEQGFLGSNNFQFNNRMHGGEIFLRAENASGTLHTLVHGNPDGNTNLHFGGVAQAGASSVGFTVLDGAVLRIEDSGSTNWADFSHDGTDFNTAFTNTADWNITGAGTYRFDADIVLAADDEIISIGSTDFVTSINFTYDSASTDLYATVFDTGANFVFKNFGTATGYIGIEDGFSFRIFDSGNTDYADFSHDGTDFNTVFTNTADWNITGFGPGGAIRTDALIFIETANAPLFGMSVTDQALDEKVWVTYAAGTQWFFGPATDAGAVTEMIAIDRTGATPTTMQLLDFSTLELINGVDLYIRDAGELRIHDSTDGDFGIFSHDGTDFNTVFTQTADWDISGLTGRLTSGAETYAYLSEAGGGFAAGTVTDSTLRWGGATWDESLLFRINAPLDTALSGTVSVTISTAAVVGVLTAFETELVVGSAIEISGEIFSVLTITDDLNLTLDSNHAAGASAVTANTDGDILHVQTGDGVKRVAVNGFGALEFSDSVGATPFTLRHDEAGATFESTNDDSFKIEGFNGLRIRREANSPTSLIVGDFILRGDSQNALIDMYAEDTGVILNHRVQNDGVLVQYNAIATALNYEWLGDGDWTFEFKDGIRARFYDGGDTDYAELHHTGTDFEFTFFQTDSVDFTGVTTGYTFDNDTHFVSGAEVHIRDGANVDWLSMAHDGTDMNFLFAGVGTTNWDISGATRMLLNDMNLRLDSRGSGTSHEIEVMYDDAAERIIFEIIGEVGATSHWRINAVSNGNGNAVQFIDVQDSSSTYMQFQSGSDVRMRDGHTFRVYDSGDADYIELAHNGTNSQIIGFQSNMLVIQDMTLAIEETSAAATDLTGSGQFWVRDDTIQKPMFTDEAGTDQVIDPSISEINTQNGNYTTVMTDKGKTIHKATSTVSITHTIDSNANVAYPIGTLMAFKNSGTVNMTVAITSDTLTGTDAATGSRTLGPSHEAVIQKLTATTWSYAASDL